MSSENIDKFFRIARERYEIMLNRKAGMERPWTVDPIFLHNRFCNVLREDDKTTVWFRENIREPINVLTKRGVFSKQDLLFSIVYFRWFNRIETFEKLFKWGAKAQYRPISPVAFFNEYASWNPYVTEEIFRKNVSSPWVTGAYIIKTPNGMDKLNGVLWCIHEFCKLIRTGKFDTIFSNTASMQEACELLQASPYLGRFMAYQICADAQYTCLLENARDINTWAQPGPGSTRGIGRIFYNDVDKFKYGNEKDEKIVINHMRELLWWTQDDESGAWPKEWPKWTMQVVQNWCCETDKYYRAEEGGHMKRVFCGT